MARHEDAIDHGPETSDQRSVGRPASRSHRGVWVGGMGVALALVAALVTLWATSNGKPTHAKTLPPGQAAGFSRKPARGSAGGASRTAAGSIAIPAPPGGTAWLTLRSTPGAQNQVIAAAKATLATSAKITTTLSAGGSSASGEMAVSADGAIDFASSNADLSVTMSSGGSITGSSAAAGGATVPRPVVIDGTVGYMQVSGGVISLSQLPPGETISPSSPSYQKLTQPVWVEVPLTASPAPQSAGSGVFGAGSLLTALFGPRTFLGDPATPVLKYLANLGQPSEGSSVVTRVGAVHLGSTEAVEYTLAVPFVGNLAATLGAAIRAKVPASQANNPSVEEAIKAKVDAIQRAMAQAGAAHIGVWIGQSDHIVKLVLSANLSHLAQAMKAAGLSSPSQAPSSSAASGSLTSVVMDLSATLSSFGVTVHATPPPASEVKTVPSPTSAASGVPGGAPGGTGSATGSTGGAVQ